LASRFGGMEAEALAVVMAFLLVPGTF